MNSIDITNVVVSHLSDSISSAVEVVQHATKLPANLNATNAQAWGTAQLGQYIGAGVAMIGAMGVGMSQGYAAGSAAMAVGRNPEAQPKILNTMIVGMAVAETTAIFALIVSILIIFVA